jgi:5S rRNA maturation endonuclease (ribonuclease M5)
VVEEAKTEYFGAKIDQMSLEGVATISFEQEVFVIFDFDSLSSEDINKLIEVYVEPGEGQNPDKVGIKSFNIPTFIKTQMEI